MSITYSITGTTEQVTFSSVGAYNFPVHFDVSNTTVTSEKITSTGAVNYLYLTDSGAKVTTLTINGPTAFNVSFDPIFASHLNTINASADTGGLFIDLTLDKTVPAFTFTGGSGVDVLKINRGTLDTLSTGSQLNCGTATSGNELAIYNLGTLTASEYNTLNTTKGFQILGLLSSSGTYINDQYLTNGFATHMIDYGASQLSITNLRSTFTLDYVMGSPGSITLGSAAYTNTALTVNITPGFQTPNTAAGLVMGALTTSGGTITNVALISNTATSANIINSYHGGDGQTLKITGNDALTIQSVTKNISVGDTIDASSFTKILTLGTIGTGTNTVARWAGDTGMGDIIKLGSGPSYLAVSSIVTGDKITLLAGHTAVDTIDTTLIGSAIAKTPYISSAAQQADITQITNFNTTYDLLKVGIGSLTLPANGISSDLTGHKWTVTNGFVTGAGLTGATGLKAFLADVSLSKTFTAHDVLAYTDGSNTYITVGDHTAGTALGEHIIELVGVHTASALGGSGASTIHLA